jgi:dethiobiotin synthetase
LAAVEVLGADALFVVTSDGNDDVERYVVDTLHATSFPVLSVYSGASKLEWSGTVVDGSFPFSSHHNPQASSVLGVVAEPAIAEPARFDAALGCLLADPRSDNLGIVFVSGDRSQVGKSSTCLALLSSLLQLGLKSQDLAYIKPVTQCEAEQLVTHFCRERGIACVGVGPIVFYKGFTRAYLSGDTESADVLVQRAVEAVRAIGVGKKLVLVDGVGYPSVGSVCGVSNADVAKALGAPVLLVGKSGVGDAIDSFNLNAAFFECRGVRVLGAVFNKLPSTGFYSRDSCAEAVGAYFRQHRQSVRAYGFVPEIGHSSSSSSSSSSALGPVAGLAAGAGAGLGGGSNGFSLDSGSDAPAAAAAATAAAATAAVEAGAEVQRQAAFLSSLSTAFAAYVDVRALLWDIWVHNRTSSSSSSSSSSASSSSFSSSGLTFSGSTSYSSTFAPALAPFPSAASASAPGVGVGAMRGALGASVAAQPFKRTRMEPMPPAHFNPNPNPNPNPEARSLKRSREEIEAAAAARGARGG